MLRVHQLNNKSTLLQALKEMKKKTREKEKPTGRSNKISVNSQLWGDAQVRDRPRSLILGQIRKTFYIDNNRILTLRVPKPKTTHFILRFCLIEKKLEFRNTDLHGNFSFSEFRLKNI